MQTEPGTKTNYILYALIAVAVFNCAAYLGYQFVVDQATDAVIERLEKDYSPSPYGPGFDPDKMPAKDAGQPHYFELKDVSTAQETSEVQSTEFWLQEWERERGAETL